MSSIMVVLSNVFSLALIMLLGHDCWQLRKVHSSQVGLLANKLFKSLCNLVCMQVSQSKSLAS